MNLQQLLGGFFKHIASFWRFIAPRIGRAFHAAFGNMHWQPPKWLSWLLHSIARLYQVLTQYLRERPRQTAITSGSVLLIVIIIGAGWLWYRAQPKPVEIGFSV